MALVKAEFAGDRRLFELEERTYECLRRSLEGVFGAGIVGIKFLDEDGDWITIDRSEELQLAFRIVDPPLRIQVSKAAEAPASSPVSSVVAAAAAPPAAVDLDAIPASYRLATLRLQERGVEVNVSELYSFMQLLRLNAKRFVKVSLLSITEIEGEEDGGSKQNFDEDDEAESDAVKFSEAVLTSSSENPIDGVSHNASPPPSDAALTEFVPPMLVTELARQGVHLASQTIHGLIVNLRIRPRRFVRCNLLPKHLAKAWNAARKDCAGGRHGHGAGGHCHRMRGRHGRRGMGGGADSAAPESSSQSPESSQADVTPHFYPGYHDHSPPPPPPHFGPPPPPHHGPQPPPPHHPFHHPFHHHRHHSPPGPEHAHPLFDRPPHGMGGPFGRGRGRFGFHHPHASHFMHHGPGGRFPPHHHPHHPHHSGFGGRMARSETPIVTVEAVRVDEASVDAAQGLAGTANPSQAQQSNRVKARFVSHLTFPDKAKVRRNTLFTKSWLVRNDHSTAWPENTQLIPVGVSARLFGVTSAVRAPASIAPSETVEVSVNLMAPNEPGMYEAYFRLCDGDTGQKFGQRLWLNVNVGEEDDADEQTNEATGHMAAAVALDALDGFDFSTITSPSAPLMAVPQP